MNTVADSYNAMIERLPPGTRIGPFIRRARERYLRRAAIDELRIEVMCRELSRLVEEDWRAEAARSHLQLIAGGRP